MRVTVSRKAHFNAAHRLYRSDWSDKKNQSIFGKCSNEFFHGHNYELIVNVTGTIDPVTGPIYNQAGELVVPEGEVAPDGMLLGMNFYVQGIDGEVPQ